MTTRGIQLNLLHSTSCYKTPRHFTSHYVTGSSASVVSSVAAPTYHQACASSLPTLDPWSKPGPAVGVAAAVSCKMGKGGIHCQKTFGQSFSENNKTSNSVPPTHRDGWQRYFNSSLCQPFK